MCPNICGHAGACPAGGSGDSNTPLRSGTTANLVAKQQLVAKINNKLSGLALNGSFSSLLGLKQPSLSSSCLQEHVNEGRGQYFGGMAKNFVRTLCARLAQHLPSSNPGHTPGVVMCHITLLSAHCHSVYHYKCMHLLTKVGFCGKCTKININEMPYFRVRHISLQVCMY